MKFSGPLGLPRLTNFGPLSVSAGANSYDDFEEVILTVAEEENIDLDSPTNEEKYMLMLSLVTATFPNDNKKDAISRNAMKQCMMSRNSEKWARRFAGVTTGDPSLYEEMILEAKYCRGLAMTGL